jgi:hypothetical protein
MFKKSFSERLIYISVVPKVEWLEITADKLDSNSSLGSSYSAFIQQILFLIHVAILLQ